VSFALVRAPASAARAELVAAAEAATALEKDDEEDPPARIDRKVAAVEYTDAAELGEDAAVCIRLNVTEL